MQSVASNENLEHVQYLVDHGADVNAKDNDGRTVLHYATMYAKMKPVWISADGNTKGKDETCVYFENDNNNLELVQWLVIEKGLDVNAKDNEGTAILHNAVYQGNPKVIQWLLEQGADIDVKDNKGLTVLHYAIENIFPSFGLIQWLIDHGADINAKDNDGKTILQYAADRRNLKLIEWLKEHGAQ
ncbi:MAG: ankyrin repeat domain-containing protein [Thermoguttaceae bacterium]|nr:ankyrin repeat domain-containing protein [Thermoguttaceae bacterium]